MKIKMIMPDKLKKGDTIGVVAPSNPIIDENIEEVKKAKEIVESNGFKVKFSKNLFSNTNGYSATAKEKAEDINEMFANKDIKMIWCAKGGNNSNSVFEYLDYDIIKDNPKIICGYSDITSLTNIINEKTGLVTFSGTNFKTIATDETDYSYNEAIKRFVEGSLEFGKEETGYKTVKQGQAEGKLIGGNLSLTTQLVSGKYKINFQDKILFIEELGFEANPVLVSNNLYFMKQNGVFDKIKGLWIGNYEHESGVSLEKIVLDVLDGEYNFPIIKSNNFGHIETKTVIPIGVMAKIDTTKDIKIELLENCVK
jgi:muramoyltetrapeptide carboxypeptidase